MSLHSPPRIERHTHRVWCALCVALLIVGCQQPVAVPEPDVRRARPEVVTAIEQARKEVMRHPQNPDVWGHLGQLCLAHQHEREAVTCFREAHRLSTNGRWAYLIGVIHEEASYLEAETWYAEAARRSPTRPAVWWRWGKVLARLDRRDEARTAWERASQLAPKSAAPRLALGRLAQLDNDPAKVREHFEAARQLAPQSQVVLRELARHAAATGDVAESQRFNDLAEAAFPGEPGLDDPWMSAIAALSRSGETLSQRADEHLAAGQWSAAEAALEELVQANPELPRAWLNLATVRAQQGRLADALSLARELTERFPDDPTGFVACARFQYLTGAAAAAKATLERALQLKPDAVEAHELLARMALAGKDFPTAERHLRSALAAAPDAAGLHISLAESLFYQGLLAEAARTLDAAERCRDAPGQAIQHWRTAIADARLPDRPVSAIAPVNRP